MIPAKMTRVGERTVFSHQLNRVWEMGNDLSTITVEEFSKQVGQLDLISMDIEGQELELLLHTASEVLLRASQISVQYHAFLWPEHTPLIEETIARMRSIGFSVYRLSRPFYTDILFVNPALKLPLSTVLRARLREYVRFVKRLIKIRLGYYPGPGRRLRNARS